MDSGKMSKLQQLAAKTVVCPGCGGKGQVAYPWFAPCPTCKGKGQVALIERLRLGCPSCYNSGKRLRFGEPLGDGICWHCNGKGWTGVSEAKAVMVLIQWCIARGWPVTFECAVEDLPPQVVVQAEDTLGVAEGNDANALADAIMQVVES